MVGEGDASLNRGEKRRLSEELNRVIPKDYSLETAASLGRINRRCLRSIMRGSVKLSSKDDLVRLASGLKLSLDYILDDKHTWLYGSLDSIDAVRALLKKTTEKVNQGLHPYKEIPQLALSVVYALRDAGIPCGMELGCNNRVNIPITLHHKVRANVNIYLLQSRLYIEFITDTATLKDILSCEAIETIITFIYNTPEWIRVRQNQQTIQPLEERLTQIKQERFS